MKMVASGRKYGPATFIPNHNLLTFTVNPYFHILALDFTVSYVQPVGQVACLLFTFDILYADSITCHFMHL